jgi:hypothetical protein
VNLAELFKRVTADLAPSCAKDIKTVVNVLAKSLGYDNTALCPEEAYKTHTAPVVTNGKGAAGHEERTPEVFKSAEPLINKPFCLDNKRVSGSSGIFAVHPDISFPYIPLLAPFRALWLFLSHALQQNPELCFRLVLFAPDSFAGFVIFSCAAGRFLKHFLYAFCFKSARRRDEPA